MSELVRNISPSNDPTRVHAWAFEYLLTRPLRDILYSAAVRTENDIIPLDADVFILRHLDIKRILRRRWIDLDSDGDHWNVLSLYQDRNGSVVPFLMIQASYTAILTETLRDQACIVEAQWPQRLSGEIIRSICKVFAIDTESGHRLHLRCHRQKVRPSKELIFC